MTPGVLDIDRILEHLDGYLAADDAEEVLINKMTGRHILRLSDDVGLDAWGVLVRLDPIATYNWEVTDMT